MLHEDISYMQNMKQIEVPQNETCALANYINPKIRSVPTDLRLAIRILLDSLYHFGVEYQEISQFNTASDKRRELQRVYGIVGQL